MPEQTQGFNGGSRLEGGSSMIFVLDNYDSFVYNLVQYFGLLGIPSVERRNDETTIEEIESLCPSCILISPGPCSPDEAGLSVEVIQHFAGRIPILGVCLGHQSIGVAFGASIRRMKEPMHGKTSLVHHDQTGLFRQLPNPIEVVRYHSLVIEESTLPECLRVNARTEDGEIMGVLHKDYPVFGVQFHPESIFTQHGLDMLKNFLELSGLKNLQLAGRIEK